MSEETITIGNATLMRGDCLERMKEIPGGSVDMILTDPPYGCTKCKWDSVVNPKALWEQYKRVIRQNGAILVFGVPPFSAAFASENLRWFRYSWYWKKTHGSGVNAHVMPLRNVDEIMVFYGKRCVYNPQFGTGKPYTMRRKPRSPGSIGAQTENTTVSDGRRFPTMVLDFKKDRGLHPTQKPVALLEYLIKTYTDEGAAVLDTFAGSGSTGVACLRTGRRFIGIELDETYFNIACERLRKEVK